MEQEDREFDYGIGVKYKLPFTLNFSMGAVTPTFRAEYSVPENKIILKLAFSPDGGRLKSIEATDISLEYDFDESPLDNLRSGVLDVDGFFEVKGDEVLSRKDRDTGVVVGGSVGFEPGETWFDGGLSWSLRSGYGTKDINVYVYYSDNVEFSFNELGPTDFELRAQSNPDGLEGRYLRAIAGGDQAEIAFAASQLPSVYPDSALRILSNTIVVRNELNVLSIGRDSGSSGSDAPIFDRLSGNFEHEPIISENGTFVSKNEDGTLSVLTVETATGIVTNSTIDRNHRVLREETIDSSGAVNSRFEIGIADGDYSSSGNVYGNDPLDPRTNVLVVSPLKVDDNGNFDGPPPTGREINNGSLVPLPRNDDDDRRNTDPLTALNEARNESQATNGTTTNTQTLYFTIQEDSPRLTGNSTTEPPAGTFSTTTTGHPRNNLSPNGHASPDPQISPDGFGPAVGDQESTQSDPGLGSARDGLGGFNGGSTSGGMPVVLDLDGDGFEISPLGSTDIRFDFDADGYFERTSWVEADDGFLVIDLNANGSRGAGDGVIDQTKELALAQLVDFQATDLHGLATFDRYLSRGGNNDGVLDARDTVWSELRVWQDANQNGLSDAGELKTLNQLGISQITLTYDDGTSFNQTSNDITALGNSLHGSASYVRNGNVVEGGLGDFTLAYENLGTRVVETGQGASIRFESPDILNLHVMDDSGDANIRLQGSGIAGVAGDNRNNNLDSHGTRYNVRLSGEDGDDVLTGGFGDDSLFGGLGADQLVGGAGNDVLYFDRNDSYISGGDGNDIAVALGETGVTFRLYDSQVEAASGTISNDNLFGGIDSSPVSVVIRGNDGNDRIDGSKAGDELSGDRGNDFIWGGAGSDELFGGANDDKLYGHVGDDRLFGGADTDRLYGGQSDDYLQGGAGNDSLYGGDDDDVLQSGSGNDSIDGGEGDDRLLGGSGDDRLQGGGGDDAIFAGEGNDKVWTHWGNDLAFGGIGDDEIYVQSWGNKEIIGGNGTDHLHIKTWVGNHTVWGGTGIDRVYMPGSRTDYTVSGGVSGYTIKRKTGNQTVSTKDVEAIVYAGTDTQWLVHRDPSKDRFSTSLSEGNELVLDPDEIDFGDNTTDTKITHSDDDTIVTFAGNDKVKSGAGTDMIYGDVGNDSLSGESGSDAISGGSGSDSLYGGSGRDFLAGGTGNDRLYGGSGDDVLDGGEENDTLDGGSGDDSLVGADGDDMLLGQFGTDKLEGRNGHDKLYGGEGDDYLLGGWGNDTLFGGEGDDVLQGTGGDDTLYGGYGEDDLAGGEGQDYLSGGHGVDSLFGGRGNDVLNGGSANDVMIGGDGNDHLIGGADNDALDGGLGADILDGGTGVFDIAYYTNSNARVVIDLETGDATGGHATGDRLQRIEEISGSKYGDRLDGNSTHNRLYGEDGDDGLYGRSGNDALYGGAGSDFLRGDAGNDTLVGGFGHDTLEGSDGRDALYGGRGRDRIDGGKGNDTVFGGAEFDIFVLRHEGGNDVIGDFRPGVDRIEVLSSLNNIQAEDTPDGAKIFIGNASLLLSGVSLSELSPKDVRLADGTSANVKHEVIGTDGVDMFESTAFADHFIGKSQSAQTWFSNLASNVAGLIGLSGAHSVPGLHTADTVDYSDSDRNVRVDLRTGTGLFGDAQGDTYDGIENLIGSDYNDLLIASRTAASSFFAGAGNDRLDGGDLNDSLFGGDGDDRFYGGAGDDLITTGLGADSVHGGDGNDTVDYSSATRNVRVNLETGIGLFGEADGDTYVLVENVIGSDFNDLLVADTEQSGTLNGGLGDDRLDGGDQDDLLIGGNGDDRLYGGSGNDLLVGGAGADSLHGGLGIDTVDYSNASRNIRVNLETGVGLFGEADGDTYVHIENVIGSDHNDLLIAKTSQTSSLFGGLGNDRLDGGDFDDRLFGGDGDDRLYGGLGDDHLVSGLGADSIHGGHGNDTVDYSGASRNVRVNLETGVGLFGEADGDTYAHIENIIGSDHGDMLIANKAQASSLFGGLGNDRLDGGDQADQLNGGLGDDRLYSGSGDDLLTGGAGADSLHGGLGIDAVDYSTASRNVRVDLETGTGCPSSEFLEPMAA